MGNKGRQLLFTVTAIAGAMIGVLPPYMDQAMARFHARSAADDLVDALNEGRALAVSRGRTVRVMVDEDLRAISVEGGRWRKLSSGIALSGPNQGAILFRPDGSSTGGQVVVSLHSRAVSVLVDKSTGKVRRVEAAG